MAVYVHFYPPFQQQYEEVGYPDKYFNDRLVQVIDHLLAAPEVQAPVLLTQPKVMSQFADPKLEGLSQKILVRMGGENAAKVSWSGRPGVLTGHQAQKPCSWRIFLI